MMHTDDMDLMVDDATHAVCDVFVAHMIVPEPEVDALNDYLLQMARRIARAQEEGRARAAQRVADRIDGYDRDDLGESPDY